ncbi:hypothetical protein E4T42_01646 [Aureobasidium subglaciale]|nr:hypothetical protein E4T42_01646 [Aureobasidium subglaciale]
MTPLEKMLGNEKCADIWLVCADGLLIPFHTVIFDLSNTLDSPFDVFIKSARLADEDFVPVPLDGQTMWRILSFVYMDTYSDEATLPPTFRTVAAPEFSREDGVAETLRNLSLDPKDCTSATLLNAWSSMQVYIAANLWSMDRLIIESSERFGGFIRGSSAEHDFSNFVNAIFNSVPDPRRLLYDQVTKECVASIETLISDDHFRDAIMKHSHLGLLLVEELTALLATYRQAFTDGDQTPSAIASALTSVDASLLLASQSRLAETESRLTETKGLLNEAENHLSVKDEGTARLEQEVARLKARPDISRPDDSMLVDQVADKINIIDNLAEQLDEKDQEIAELREEMAVKDQKITDLGRLNHDLTQGINSNRSSMQFTTDLMIECNESREKITALQALLQTFETKHEELLALTAPRAETQEDLVVNKASIPQPAAGKDSQPANTSQSADDEQSANRRRPVHGFGMLEEVVDGITSGNAFPTEAPAAATTRSLPAPAIATHIARGGGPLTFPERLAQRRTAQMAEMAEPAERAAVAGILGGERVEAPQEAPEAPEVTEDTGVREGPTSMPLVPRGALTAAQQPVLSVSNGASANGEGSTTTTNGASRGPQVAAASRRAGPHARNGGSASVASASSSANAVPQTPSEPRTPTVARTFAESQTRAGPHTRAAAPQVNGGERAPANAPTGPATVVVTNGHTNFNPVRDAVVEQQQAQLNRLQAEIAFLRGQLNDARTGPAANVQTRDQNGRGGREGRGGGGFGGAGGSAQPRLDAILTALKEYDLDHKACNDCGINFNSEWRGVVDDPHKSSLILLCRKCGEKKCHWDC